jgi:hypothetical protein
MLNGYTKTYFTRAMERLFAARQITMQEYGRKSDLRRKTVRWDHPKGDRKWRRGPPTEAAE